jgi:shikimate dehydrogenase
MHKGPSIKIYGLLGHPVRHSLSPVMYNAAFRTLKIKAQYKLFEKPPNELKDFLGSLRKHNIYGLNVTIPYKEKVLAYLNRQSSAVKAIGAANTILVNKDGKLNGYNTDYLGFSKHIFSELKLKPKKAAIIGAGGAAKAVVYALARKGVQEIRIYDIDKYKSLSLMRGLRRLFPKCHILAMASVEELDIKNRDLFVNASPVGMHKEDPCLVNSSMLHSGIFIYDLIYNPAETKLLKLASGINCPYSNGLGMLLYQGIESFNIWMKPKRAPVETMRKTLTEEIKKW